MNSALAAAHTVKRQSARTRAVGIFMIGDYEQETVRLNRRKQRQLGIRPSDKAGSISRMSLLWSQLAMRHVLECPVIILQAVKSDVFPEFHARHVIIHDEDVALLDAFGRQRLQARPDQ